MMHRCTHVAHLGQLEVAGTSNKHFNSSLRAQIRLHDILEALGCIYIHEERGALAHKLGIRVQPRDRHLALLLEYGKSARNVLPNLGTRLLRDCTQDSAIGGRHWPAENCTASRVRRLPSSQSAATHHHTRGSRRRRGDEEERQEHDRFTPPCGPGLCSHVLQACRRFVLERESERIQTF